MIQDEKHTDHSVARDSKLKERLGISESFVFFTGGERGDIGEVVGVCGCPLITKDF